MPKAKKTKTAKKTQRRSSSAKNGHNSHVLYGCLAIIGGVVVGMVLFGMLMQ